MIINHNIAALNTHRQLSTNTANTNKNIEKLSSGLRINRAGDDAAGLAISEKMRGQIRGLDQATRNAQDGISLIQTAEGALNETHSILQRMRELAVQSSNDTNTGQDRGELQKEMNQLTSEINRIGNTTEFNTKKLLNGDLSDKFMTKAAVTTPGAKVDVTKAVDQTIKVGAEPVSWTGTSKADVNVKITGTADNGFDFGNIDETAAAGKNEIKITRTGDKFTVDFDGVDKAGTAKTLEINADDVAFDPATKTYTYNNQGINFSFTQEDAKDWKTGESVTIDLKTIGNDATGDHKTVAEKVALTVTGTTAGAGAASAVVSDIVVDGDSKSIIAGADKLDIEWDETSKSFTATLSAGGTKLSETKFSLDEGETLNYDADGIKFSFTATGDTANDGNIKGSFALKTATTKVETAPDVTAPAEYEDKSASFQIGANQNQSLSLGVNDMRASALGITGAGAGFSSADNVTNGTNNTNAEKALDLTSNTNAANAITVVDKAIASVSSERSKLGAVQNRLEHTINNLGTSSENLTAAESRIRDVDMAKEMMSQTKNNILAQAAQAMLAQANQQPQGVLQLLR
ncbi:flagellin [Paenibacillus sp. FSL R5-0486]|uniref:flagellin N-terminal helical domain-containing protein n=1 Tax=Paenibacillus sp. FSL R5-0486 TaxID=2921645 RepID=UPI0030DD1856